MIADDFPAIARRLKGAAPAASDKTGSVVMPPHAKGAAAVRYNCGCCGNVGWVHDPTFGGMVVCGTCKNPQGLDDPGEWYGDCI